MHYPAPCLSGSKLSCLAYNFDLRTLRLGRRLMAKVDIYTLKKELQEIQERWPAWTLDNAFVHWFLRAFLVADDEIAARAVTGVSHDKGNDAVLIDEDTSKVFLLQGKCHLGDKPPHEARADVLEFARLAKVVCGSDAEYKSYSKGIAPIVGEKLDRARSRIKKREFALHLYYVSTGICSSPLKDEAESLIRQANGRTEVNILDRKEILALLTDYLGGAAPPVPFLDLRIDAHGIVGSDGVIQRFDQETGIESWILTMTGNDVGNLYTTAGDRLFARNIRGFLGDTAINEGMRETLQKEAEHFWYFNNGITVVCDSARKTAERGEAILRVSNPQIINGQQTTRTLHKHLQKRASVIVRVISIPRDAHHNEHAFDQLVSNIVAATNWQNAILPSDLRSNDQRQVALERDFAKLNYRYIRKRQTKREAKRLWGSQAWLCIKKAELAQAVAGCEFDPRVVRKGKEGLFKAPYYGRIFDRRPDQYLAMYWLSRVVKRKASGFHDRSYAKWVVLNALWTRVGGVLSKKRHADAFRVECERYRWNRHLDKAAEQLYLAALTFYRANRGAGATAVDVSNFFYRAGLMKGFEQFWRSRLNRRRGTVSEAVRLFGSDLAEK